ncbi:MAG: YggU family protein [Limnohabitans sp.]|jgi:uncharacterized protein (TIGR00251 family)|nr:YggU family protein [Limnohabitans sp.]
MSPVPPWRRIDKDGSAIVDIHVIPRASRTQAEGVHDGALKVRLHAPPVDGQANQALMEWLSDRLGIAKREVELLRGATSRRKQLRISAAATPRADWSALD